MSEREAVKEVLRRIQRLPISRREDQLPMMLAQLAARVAELEMEREPSAAPGVEE